MDPDAQLIELYAAEPTADLVPYLRRLLGYHCEDHVAWAERAVDRFRDRTCHLGLRGSGDLVPVAAGIHRRAVGQSPFLVVDPRRVGERETVRSPGNRALLAHALADAQGGTVCVRSMRLPQDWREHAHRFRSEDVRLAVCSSREDHEDEIERAILAPIEVPDLATRGQELDAIIDEYVADARAALGVSCDLSQPQRAWIRGHVRSHPMLEKTALRFIALAALRYPSQAAHRLGMAPVSLSRWLRRNNISIELARGQSVSMPG